MAIGKLASLVIAISMLHIMPLSTAWDGTATFYLPPYVPSACDGYQNDGTMIAAASDAIWNNGAACWSRYSVTCTGAAYEGSPQPCWGSGSITVTIVDYCPPGACYGTIDLSQEAFASIANPDAGIINIDLYQV